ncbi:response regulator [Algoriphagus sp.]|uniref:response regulator n=1 Tax=Algoriphagus sp. TaxID=1872435 RepID=UPI00391D983D
MDNFYKILIADDHELFSTGLENLLNKNPNFKVLSGFRNGKDLLNYFEEGGEADLLILDLNMPVMDGIQFLTYIQRKFCAIKVLVVSMYLTESTLKLCQNLGAHGYVCKDSSLQILLKAVDEILNGNFYFQETSPEKFEEANPSGFYQKLKSHYRLSDREIDIIQLIINQYEGNEIAEKLHLSPLTVKTHRKNIFRKLGVRNLAGLVALMREEPGI